MVVKSWALLAPRHSGSGGSFADECTAVLVFDVIPVYFRFHDAGVEFVFSSPIQTVPVRYALLDLSPWKRRCCFDLGNIQCVLTKCDAQAGNMEKNQ
jgi:hypothetical protein